jgi:hypothetical protein
MVDALIDVSDHAAEEIMIEMGHELLIETTMRLQPQVPILRPGANSCCTFLMVF